MVAGPQTVERGRSPSPAVEPRPDLPADTPPDRDEADGQRWTLPEAARDAPVPPPCGPLTIRLRSPILQLTVAHVGGILEESTAKQLGRRLGVLFGRSVHVVVDLTEITVLTRGGVRALLGLHRAATSRGTQLYLVRPSANATGTGRRQLGRLASDRLVRLVPTAEAVLAQVLAAPRTTTSDPA
ncbi:STAS domain-containing protein [Pseudonocardia sediminis]|uniref:STAS domain-containing protein n=1 Tax=Pseudonocardia sediminis TaxID=1397368 RepID=UPI00102A8724|nr:STAS domain-containing protein [Pseudonocardia sediminis]